MDGWIIKIIYNKAKSWLNEMNCIKKNYLEFCNKENLILSSFPFIIKIVNKLNYLIFVLSDVELNERKIPINKNICNKKQ